MVRNAISTDLLEQTLDYPRSITRFQFDNSLCASFYPFGAFAENL